MVAFGDSGNELTFGESACTFVAMGNATPEIKAIADDICPPDTIDIRIISLKAIADDICPPDTEGRRGGLLEQNLL